MLSWPFIKKGYVVLQFRPTMSSRGACVGGSVPALCYWRWFLEGGIRSLGLYLPGDCGTLISLSFLDHEVSSSVCLFVRPSVQPSVSLSNPPSLPMRWKALLWFTSGVCNSNGKLTFGVLSTSNLCQGRSESSRFHFIN